MSMHGAGEEECKMFIPMCMIKIVAILMCMYVYVCVFWGESEGEAVERGLVFLALLSSWKIVIRWIFSTLYKEFFHILYLFKHRLLGGYIFYCFSLHSTPFCHGQRQNNVLIP